MTDLVIARDAFRVWGLRGEGHPRVALGGAVTTVTWDDDGSILSGSVSLQKPGYGTETLPITGGNQLMLEHGVVGGTAFREVWRMRLIEPQSGVPSGVVSYTLQSDMQLLLETVDDWRFVKDKAHPRGWLVHDAIAYVLRRCGCTVGTLATTRTYVTKAIFLGRSALSAILQLLHMERLNSGLRFLLFFRLGRFFITPPRYTSRMLDLKEQIIDASVQSTRNKDFATALTVRATPKVIKAKDAKGHTRVAHRKIAVEVRSDPLIARFGYVHKIWHTHADSEAEARRIGLRRLVQVATPLRDISLTIQGDATIARGDACRLTLPQVGLAKADAYVKEAHHSVSAGAFETQLVVGFDSVLTPQNDALTRVT